MDKKTWRIDGRILFPVSAPPLKDFSIIINANKIERIIPTCIAKGYKFEKILSVPDGIILPGFVNTHAHLELTSLGGKIKPGTPFTAWIREVVSKTSAMSNKEFESAKLNGIKRLIESGTTTVADISSRCPKYIDHGIRYIDFVEVLGFNAASFKKEGERLLGRIKAGIRKRDNNRYMIGISPHAPYSVSPQLFEMACKTAKEYSLPFSVHLSESKEEAELLKKGTGPFERLLKEFNKWDSEWKPPFSSPVKYLESLGVLNNLIAIHTNFIDSQEIDILKENSVSVVYCPLSNKWFERDLAYPLKNYMERGINLAVGTDSMASNTCLNLLEELKYIKNNYPDIKGDYLLEMATVNGAKALGLNGSIGLLREGMLADLIVIKSGEDDIILPSSFDEILERKNRLLLSIVDGKIIYDNYKKGDNKCQLNLI